MYDVAKEFLPCEFHVGELMEVVNHGEAWLHLAQIITLNLSKNDVMIQWENTGKKEIVDFSLRKRKAPDFYNSEISVGKTKRKTDGEMIQEEALQNDFFQPKKFKAAEEAIKNLQSMLNYSPTHIDLFWNLCNSLVSELLAPLEDESIPKAV